jgi:uncharacterized membrane protein
MKDFLLSIKNRINNLFIFKKISPHNHWNNLLYIFFTITIILIIFSLYLLLDIKNQKTLQIMSELTEKPVLVDEKLFTKVNEIFNNKVLKQKEIKDGLHTYKDPSL